MTCNLGNQYDWVTWGAVGSLTYPHWSCRHSVIWACIGCPEIWHFLGILPVNMVVLPGGSVQRSASQIHTFFKVLHETWYSLSE